MYSFATRSGQDRLFHSTHCFERYGFHVGDLVQTPRGRGWIVGESNDDLYFLMEKDTGASKWKGAKKDTFRERQFKVIYSPTREAERRLHFNAPAFKAMLNQSEFSDVSFLLDDGEIFYAYRGVLASRSEYFSALFKKNQTLESNLPQVRIEQMASPVFLQILEYLYTGTVDLADSVSVYALAHAADQYLLKNLLEKISDYFSIHLDKLELGTIILMADKYHMEEYARSLSLSLSLSFFY